MSDDLITLRTISEIADEKTLIQVNSLVDHLHSIRRSFKRVLKNSDFIQRSEDNTQLLPLIFPKIGGTKKTFIKNADISKIILLIQDDIKVISDKLTNQFTEQYGTYQDTYDRVAESFHIYPKEIVSITLESQLSNSFLVLNTHIDSHVSNLLPNDDYWKQLIALFDEVLDIYDSSMESIWSEIEKLDKYQNDHGRFGYAKWGFRITIVMILVGQSKNIYDNLFWLWESFSSLFK